VEKKRPPERVKREIVRTCHAGFDSGRLRREVLARLRTVVPFEAVCFPTADPATLMITGNVGEGLPPEASRGFFRVEYGADDFNKFSRLARSRNRVRTLSEATEGDFERSARWREVFGPLGLDDDLRAALIAEGNCWGYLALHREAAKGSFTPEEARFVAELSGHLAAGLRKALLLENVEAAQAAEGPGLLLLDDQLQVVASTPAADYWLLEVGRSGKDIGNLPSPILAAASSVQALEREGAEASLMPRSRLRTDSGRWLVVHASRLAASEEPRGRIAVILELAHPLEIAPLIAAAYGLSDRERQVLQQVVIGLSTMEIAKALFISSNTVQDHLKAIFEKTGVRSRRELVAQIFTQQYLPRIWNRNKLGADGWFAQPASAAGAQ
jgi:DNA-binding CsgD family transcriptional regulator